MFKVKLGLLVVYLLLLESALISSTTAFRVRKDRNVTKTKVLILGGGLSGITAAKTLLDNNIKDFYVLEGQDYIGGRIHAAQFEGVTIEEGANWLHSLDEELSARFLKWKTHKSMEGIWCNYSDFIIRDENGFDVTDWKLARKFQEEIEENLEDVLWARKRKNMPDIPARVGLQLMGWRSDKPIEKES